MSEIFKKVSKQGKTQFYTGCITGMVLCFVLINLLFSYDAIRLQRPCMGLFIVQAEIQCIIQFGKAERMRVINVWGTSTVL